MEERILARLEQERGSSSSGTLGIIVALVVALVALTHTKMGHKSTQPWRTR